MGVEYLAARRYVYQLDEDSADFTQGEKRIPVATIKGMVDKCFETPIQMAQDIIRSIENVGRIDVSGGATSSNRYIQHLWESAIQQSRSQTARKGGNSRLDVRFLEPEDAAYVAASVSTMAQC